MRKILFYFIFFVQFTSFGQKKTLFDDTKVSSVYITIAQDSLNLLLKSGNEESIHYFPCQFIFDDGTKKDTVAKAGFRLRGNTSRYSQKKSFKVSFNEFTVGGKYQGVKKINLNGSHNDPTMIREKLFYDIWNKDSNAKRRANFVRLYVNQEYKGLYTNIEEIDADWVKNAYGDNTGNLYKCTYPADLAYISDNQSSYKNIKNNPITRAYDLVTNEALDDYSGLVNLIKILDQNPDNQFVIDIKKVLNVDNVLKAYAIDIATGNWDNYAYNKNNYYLYHNLKTGKFEYMTYDTDNTMGIDWLNKDWVTRNCYAWLPTSGNEKRPLISKLLAVPEFKTQFSTYLNNVTRKITISDSIFPRIDSLKKIIKTAAYEDTYKGKDYGYTNTSWENGFTKTVDTHSPYGLKPFFGKRYTNTIAQVVVQTIDYQEDSSVLLYPNPTNDALFLQDFIEKNIESVTIIDLNGRLISQQLFEEKISVTALPQGFYYLKMQGKERVWIKAFLKK